VQHIWQAIQQHPEAFCISFAVSFVLSFIIGNAIDRHR
jgi:hypothetical protein